MTRKRYQQLILDAAALIERTGWTRGAAARKADGITACRPGAIEAVRFSVFGAIARARHEGGGSIQSVNLARARLCRIVGVWATCDDVERWNDDLPKLSGKATVIATLREAAKL